MQMPSDLKPYFDVQDTLSHQDGSHFEGRKNSDSTSLRDITKKRPNSEHLGYDSMIRRARDTVFWPAMPEGLHQLDETREACQLHKP